LCTNATLCLKLLIEKRREYNLDTHLLFLDYEKASDTLQRQIMFNVLEARNIPDKLLKAIVDIYRRNKVSIKLNSECSKKVDTDKDYATVAHYHHLYSVHTHTHTHTHTHR
jgi:hypothetical protein